MADIEHDEDEAKTHVYDRTMFPPKPSPEAAAAPIASTTVGKAPESGIIYRSPNADPPPPWWRRLGARIDRGISAFLDYLFGRHNLTNELPPIPRNRPRTGTLIGSADVDAENGEQLFLAILRATVVYQDSAIAVANRALAARRESETAYHDFVVHSILSRMRPDADGRIPIEWLQEAALTMPRLGSLTKSLIRLEAKGHVKLVLDMSAGDPMTELLRDKITHIEVLVPV